MQTLPKGITAISHRHVDDDIELRLDGEGGPVIIRFPKVAVGRTGYQLWKAGNVCATLATKIGLGEHGVPWGADPALTHNEDGRPRTPSEKTTSKVSKRKSGAKKR